MKIQRKSDIVPLIMEQKLSIRHISKIVKRSEPTLWRWVKELREAGYKIEIEKGRKKMPL